MVAQEVDASLDAPVEATVLLKFASANTDAVIDVTVLVRGEQWTGSVTQGTIESDLDGLRDSLRVWLRTFAAI
ncbi:MAG: hypothetical protein JWN34_2541 [Bryobacterales bacterium]|jgi:hypothetical protein|nr:hypothetical protein [Bryobacterales bacterium]